MALEVRHLRYVVQVADDGSLSRAAQRLGVTQPTLSQQVLKVERELGFSLFDRHPRGASPTPAGAAFLSDARTAIGAFDDAVERATRRARGETGELFVGFTAAAGLELTPLILAAYGERHPKVEVHLREHPLSDPSAGLADGSADVAFVRPPLGTPGLWFEPLLSEPRVVAVSSAHPLARRSSVAVAELLDEPMVASGGDPVSEAFWLLAEHRDGRPSRIAAHADTYETELQIVASGRAVAITCAASARYFVRPGVTFVPVRDIAPSSVALGFRAGEADPLVLGFLGVARQIRDGAAAGWGAPS